MFHLYSLTRHIFENSSTLSNNNNENHPPLVAVAFDIQDCSGCAIHLIDLVELTYETVRKWERCEGSNVVDLTDLFFSPFNIDNSMATNFINPINTLVTGEVLIERNKHLPNTSHFPLDRVIDRFK